MKVIYPPIWLQPGVRPTTFASMRVADRMLRISYVFIDAGTLHFGIDKAISNKVFGIPAAQVIKQYIKGYLISHAHLDHVAWLIINSTDDTAKYIYALASCIETLKTRYFTWQAWINFGDEGEAPVLKKYHYQVIVQDSVTGIKNTEMNLQAFSLSHSNIQSTAFLISSKGAYILYVGDTGPDEIEKSNDLHILWQSVAPLVKNKQLKAILIETSFPDEQPDKNLFGHLTPHWLMKEMADLARITGQSALKGFNIIITHVKPPETNIAKIKAELRAQNTLKLNLVFPEQGKALNF